MCEANPADGRSGTMAAEGGEVTGTKDKDYNIIWFVEQCPDNALRLEAAGAEQVPRRRPRVPWLSLSPFALHTKPRPAAD